ncbi:MAG: 23S rRNA (adenine(2503)-C(2))-methyltransferase RlmN [Synergistaceae bacterium]|nr:23S rRNA (adenine(2503)-C(2))-methyltransferase RlmN [Synergistaceae bacterium]MBQ6919755.1 23S rRNA (adenine(2503)-C(2))-methyltransferase RlmN [Synergistaceae bacterium]MBQ6969103.1 23S rRNA (adenine(2503)-C(2))-methyltransferase RlmN [Synergistaceae bacterium]
MDALELSLNDWQLLFAQWGEQKFRASQVCQWIYAKKEFTYDGMTNLSKALREKLNENITMSFPIMLRQQVSKDGTKKFLWSLNDGAKIESVLLNHGGHKTACISSQAGCPLKCSFCETGANGFTRNLTRGEILGQFLMMEKINGSDINNIVFMGMGEPLLNEDNVFSAIRSLNDKNMRNLGARHITISTSGIATGIEDLADFEIPVRLSLSLHAPNDELRSRLMPVNKNFPLQKLVASLRRYRERTGERITIEYALIDRVNDAVEYAYETAALLDGLEPYVNIIPFNPIPSKPELKRSDSSRVKAFCNALSEMKIEFELRKERGGDISAACGQLAGGN